MFQKFKSSHDFIRFDKALIAFAGAPQTPLTHCTGWSSGNLLRLNKIKYDGQVG